LTGFTQPDVNPIFHRSVNNGYTIISGYDNDYGTLQMTMKKTNNLRNNGSQGTGTVVLSLNKSAGGNVDVTVENSTNSGKALSEIHSDSNSSLVTATVIIRG